MGTSEPGCLSEPVPPESEEVLTAVSPLVACCPTFEAASSTVEYLCSEGVPREGLCVMVGGVRPAAGALDRGRWFGRGNGRSARRRVPGSSDSSLMTSRRYYVISDQRSARRARRLLADGADAQGEAFGMHAVPCVGQLPPKSLHPSNGVMRVSWWSRAPFRAGSSIRSPSGSRRAPRRPD